MPECVFRVIVDRPTAIQRRQRDYNEYISAKQVARAACRRAFDHPARTAKVTKVCGKRRQGAVLFTCTPRDPHGATPWERKQPRRRPLAVG